MRTLLISVALLSAASAALEAQVERVYYVVPQATARVLQDTSSSFTQRLARLFTRRDTTRALKIAMFPDSSQMPVCAMPVHVPDTSQSRMPVTKVSPQAYEMPVANRACRNPLFNKSRLPTLAPKR